MNTSHKQFILATLLLNIVAPASAGFSASELKSFTLQKNINKEDYNDAFKELTTDTVVSLVNEYTEDELKKINKSNAATIKTLNELLQNNSEQKKTISKFLTTYNDLGSFGGTDEAKKESDELNNKLRKEVDDVRFKFDTINKDFSSILHKNTALFSTEEKNVELNKEKANELSLTNGAEKLKKLEKVITTQEELLKIAIEELKVNIPLSVKFSTVEGYKKAVKDLSRESSEKIKYDEKENQDRQTTISNTGFFTNYTKTLLNSSFWSSIVGFSSYLFLGKLNVFKDFKKLSPAITENRTITLLAGIPFVVAPIINGLINSSHKKSLSTKIEEANKRITSNKDRLTKIGKFNNLIALLGNENFEENLTKLNEEKKKKEEDKKKDEENKNKNKEKKDNKEEEEEEIKVNENNKENNE